MRYLRFFVLAQATGLLFAGLARAFFWFVLNDNSPFQISSFNAGLWCMAGAQVVMAWYFDHPRGGD